MAEVRAGHTAKMYVCNTPFNDCTGGNNKNGGKRKLHSSRAEAFRCYTRWLKSQGYTQLKPTQYAPPDGGPVLLISKPSKYGLRMKGEGPKGKGRYIRHHNSECFIT